MPDKTHSELIRELYRLVGALDASVDEAQRGIERHEAALNRLNESLAALSTRVAVLEHQAAELQKKVEESGRRFWALLPPLLAAILGGIIALLGQLLLFYLRK